MKLSYLSFFLLTTSFVYAESIEEEIPERISTDLALNTFLPQGEIAPLSLDNPIQQPITQGEICPDAPMMGIERRSPALAASLSFLYPGLGHAYLEDMKTALLLSGTFAGAYQIDPSLTVSLNTYFYGIYAAYRDAKLQNGINRYSYRMPTDSFKDLAYAPFNINVMKKVEVWGGLLVDLSLAAALVTLYKSIDKKQIRHDINPIFLGPFAAFAIGIGEESFFRGFIQSALAESFSPWKAITLSSFAFGAAHFPNALYYDSLGNTCIDKQYCALSLPFITALGFYFGYLTHKNRSLKESVAIHAWYDFILMGGVTSALLFSNSIKNTNFSISIPF